MINHKSQRNFFNTCLVPEIKISFPSLTGKFAKGNKSMNPIPAVNAVSFALDLRTLFIRANQ